MEFKVYMYKLGVFGSRPRKGREGLEHIRFLDPWFPIAPQFF